MPHVLLFVYDESAHITTIECDNRQVLAQVRDDSGARKLQITLRDVMLLRSACTGIVASHIHCIKYMSYTLLSFQVYVLCNFLFLNNDVMTMYGAQKLANTKFRRYSVSKTF